MKAYLFASDVVMSYFNKQRGAIELVEHLASSNKIFISVLSYTEIIAGWNEEKRAVYLPRLQSIFDGIPVSQEIAEQAGEYRNEYKADGKQLATVDTVIAAMATQHHLTLVTRNTKDFPMPELELCPIESEQAS